MPMGVYVHPRGEKAPRWQGGKAWYDTVHDWMNENYGKPLACEHCDSVNKRCKNGRSYYEWANISGKYQYDRLDWKRLCMSCHRKIDDHLMARGEKASKAKLTVSQVQRIRLMKQVTPELSQRKLAKMFNVTHQSIGAILNRKNWNHIE